MREVLKMFRRTREQFCSAVPYSPRSSTSSLVFAGSEAPLLMRNVKKFSALFHGRPSGRQIHRRPRRSKVSFDRSRNASSFSRSYIDGSQPRKRFNMTFRQFALPRVDSVQRNAILEYRGSCTYNRVRHSRRAQRAPPPKSRLCRWTSFRSQVEHDFRFQLCDCYYIASNDESQIFTPKP